MEKRAPQSESDSSPAPVLFSMQVKTRILIRMLSFFSSLSVYGFLVVDIILSQPLKAF